MNQADIKRVAVIGAGTMGAGIALSFALSGRGVRLYDISEKQLEAGLERIQNKADLFAAEGVSSQAETDTALAKIETTTELAHALEDVDLVNEAAPEDLKLKQEMFARMEGLVGPGSILASNSSGLSISAIASACEHPQRVAGLHWFNPPELVPLVEIIKGEQTSGETAQTLRDLIQEMGKAPVLVNKDLPGFVGNRLQYALLREALHLVATGVASPEDVDTAVKRGLGFRWSWIGPMETADLGGLDVFYSVSDYLFADLCDDKRPQEFFKQRVEAGKLGAKTGEGFYKYSPEQLPQIIGQRDLYFVRQAQLIKQIQDK